MGLAGLVSYRFPVLPNCLWCLGRHEILVLFCYLDTIFIHVHKRSLRKKHYQNVKKCPFPHQVKHTWLDDVLKEGESLLISREYPISIISLSKKTHDTWQHLPTAYIILKLYL